ncbi:MAG: class I SAM-dependent methyltransferase [Cyanobium sp. 49614_E6]|nr:class I SAM-dependent methyltransferase [Cyanobium sp. 49614_E6]
MALATVASRPSSGLTPVPTSTPAALWQGDMERIVEPELMDDPLQARAYAEADFDRSDQAFAERFLALLGQPFPDGIVDLGCGPGNISFRLAAALPDARVLGVDGAASMVALAAEHQQRHPGAWPQLRFQQLKLPLADPVALGGSFAAVVSNSLLHHLHDPQVLWQAVGQLAAPGATIYIKDLRRPASAAAADALTELHAAGAPAVLRRDFRASLAAAASPGRPALGRGRDPRDDLASIHGG